MRQRNLWIVASGAAAGASGFFYWRSKRARRAEAERLRDLLGWKEGRVVAEVGAGGGDFAAFAARSVGPSGLVFATEADPRKLKRLRKRARTSPNVTVSNALETDSNLPSGSCDAVSMRGVYHHFTHPEQMNASLYRALRPGGLLAVVDFPPKWLLTLIRPVGGVPANRGGHGVPKQIVVDELTSAGFEFVREVSDWPSRARYGLLFRKPADSAAARD
jgi:ubiquinone/menaquinone biosynthesis C-methylase UbiE